MIKRTTRWALALGMMIPAATQAQQNPALIGEGAQVYSANCGRCHNARASTERTDADWIPIVMHMRVRANLTRAQADAVLAYLQATNAPERSASGSAGEATEEAAGAATNRVMVMPRSLREALARVRPAPAPPGRGEDPGGH